jgi:hypothetical protein
MSESYDVYSQLKNSWRVRRNNKKLIVELDGKITLLGETEDTKEIYYMRELNQIIWNNSTNLISNPQANFIFKDEKLNFEIYFEHEQQFHKFLKFADEIVKKDNDQRRDMFIVK